MNNPIKEMAYFFQDLNLIFDEIFRWIIFKIFASKAEKALRKAEKECLEAYINFLAEVESEQTEELHRMTEQVRKRRQKAIFKNCKTAVVKSI